MNLPRHRQRRERGTARRSGTASREGDGGSSRPGDLPHRTAMCFLDHAAVQDQRTRKRALISSWRCRNRNNVAFRVRIGCGDSAAQCDRRRRSTAGMIVGDARSDSRSSFTSSRPSRHGIVIYGQLISIPDLTGPGRWCRACHTRWSPPSRWTSPAQWQPWEFGLLT